MINHHGEKHKMARPTSKNPTSNIFIKSMLKNGRTVTEAEKTVLYALESGDIIPSSVLEARNTELKAAKIASLRASLKELEA